MPTAKDKVKAKPAPPSHSQKETPRIVIPAGDIVVDRSRLIDFQQCPRMGFYNYFAEGTGVVPVKANLYTTRGHALHVGVGEMFKQTGHRPGNNCVNIIQAGEAIEAAILAFEKEARSGLELIEGEANPPDVDEQKMLIEGALWAFYFTAYMRIVAQFNILDVEREEACRLGPGVTLLARTDALLEHRVNKTLHVWSLKTTKTYDKRKEADAETDIQGLSEALAIESRVGKKIHSIQMCYFVLGKRDKIKTDIGTEEVVTRSPFCYGYRRVGGGIGQSEEYFASQYWKCHEPHVTTHTKKPSQCPGNKTHKIGDDFEMFPISEYDGGVQGWVRDILNDRVAPGHTLIEGGGDRKDGLIILPAEYFRQERDMVSFQRQAFKQAQELYFQKNLYSQSKAGSKVKPGTELEFETAMLDYTFRQHKHRCNYPGPCDFRALCFPHLYPGVDINKPVLTLGYKKRKFNHPAEEQALEQM